MTDTITFTPIGIIHTPFKQKEDVPIQPAFAQETRGTIEVYPAYAPGLKDLDGFSHIIVLFHLHLSSGYKLQVKPFLDDKPRGLFSTRAPRRPNGIGLSIVKLERIVGNVLYVSMVDMLDGSPLLDIKPHVPTFDDRDAVRIGWLEGKVRAGEVYKSDERFS